MRYGEVSVNSTDTVVKQSTTVPKKIETKVEETEITIVEETKEDKTKPVQGYYMEKTTPQVSSEDNDDDNDEMDTQIHPDKRIKETHPGIVLNKLSDKLTAAINQAVDKASNSGVEEEDISDRYFTQAQNMINHNNANDIFKYHFPTGTSVYTKTRGQITGYSYDDKDVQEECHEDAQNIEIGGTYSSKKGKTKLVFLGSATRFSMKTKEIMPQEEINDYASQYQNTESSDIEITPDEIINTHDADFEDNSENLEKPILKNETESAYTGFIAAQQKFNNDDILTGNAFINHDAVQDSRTISVNTDYYLSKYGASLKGEITSYNGEDSVNTTKTYFSCTFNPEMEEIVENSSLENGIQANTNSFNRKISDEDKKWETSLSPFFDTEAIEGTPEEGLGLKLRAKKKGMFSSTRFGTFAKLSTAQKEGDKSDLYHITTGISAKYRQSIGKNGVITFTGDVKDKVTFGEGNIFTATGEVKYQAKKIALEAEAMYISVPNSSYKGLSAEISYTPNNKLHAYTEVNNVDWKYTNGQLSGTNFNIGLLYNFDAAKLLSSKNRNKKIYIQR